MCTHNHAIQSQIVAVLGGTLGLVAVDALLGGGGSSSIGTGPFGIETIGSHYGVNAIPSSLPSPHIPVGLTDLGVLSQLMQPALSIALLAAIESLLCARVSDTMIGSRHNPNTELIAQGVANVASAAFGGLPATGALARTAANVRAGGRSPIAGCVHAATILTIMMVSFVSDLCDLVPALVLCVCEVASSKSAHVRSKT
jgi:MFS superfamily sulfate permease-like transporter